MRQMSHLATEEAVRLRPETLARLNPICTPTPEDQMGGIEHVAIANSFGSPYTFEGQPPTTPTTVRAWHQDCDSLADIVATFCRITSSRSGSEADGLAMWLNELLAGPRRIAAAEERCCVGRARELLGRETHSSQLTEDVALV